MRRLLAPAPTVGAVLLAAVPLSAQTQPAASPPAAPPLYATTKVEGTENVYVFRYQGHQSMFVVTPEGVIATDPIGLGRPQAVTTYIDEIKRVTSHPIRYVIYSHSHYDHITGGQPFKDLGARFIAHKNAKAQLERLQPPNIVLPDEVVDNQHILTLGGTTLELIYVGRNHSDNSLVMRLPKEKIIFAVDFIPVQAVFWRSMPDS
jgi:glyoxylase-like metal-dependent hydrolase (beta-lactamase superfamily II)